MNTRYVSTYKENININDDTFDILFNMGYMENTKYDYAFIESNMLDLENFYNFLSDYKIQQHSHIDILFDGFDCCQVRNITTLPTLDHDTSINANGVDVNIKNILDFNDVNYDNEDLKTEFDHKHSLQLTSLPIDTYIDVSKYIYNNFTNSIVSVLDDDLKKLRHLNEQILNAIMYIDNPIDNPSEIYESIHIECLYNKEYIWRTDESLKNIYNLPMLYVEVTFDNDKNIKTIEIKSLYNNFNANAQNIVLYNLDENFNHTSQRMFSVEDLKKLFDRTYIKDTNKKTYIEDTIEYVQNTYGNKIQKYYFYIANLTTEFIHFNNIVEYNFNDQLALWQYTLVVFDEAMTTNILFSQDHLLNEFVKSWKYKNDKYTVDDIKKLVNEIKRNYTTYIKQLNIKAHNYAQERSSSIVPFDN